MIRETFDHSVVETLGGYRADPINSFMVSAIARPKTSKSFIYVYIERLAGLQ